METTCWQLVGCWAILASAAPDYLHAEDLRTRTERALDQPTNIKLIDTPLKDVCRWLSHQH